MTPKELHDLRKSKGMSQQGLAEHLEVSRLTIANWEKGRYTIPSDLLARITGAPDVERPEKPLAGDQYYRKVGKGAVTRTLSHPFWYLGVNSPYRKKMEAAGAQWRETATTRDLEGYTAPTPQQAYDMLLAHGCDPHSSHWYLADYMGYHDIPKPPLILAPDVAQYKADWAKYQETNPGGGWRDFEALYPQHRASAPAREPTPEEKAKSDATIKALDAAFNLKTAKD